MSLLPAPHVVHRQAVVGVGAGLRADVDHHRRRDELPERDLIDRLPVLREVDGRIEVCPAVLGRAQRVRGVEPAAGSVAKGELLQLEARRRGGPVEGLLVEGVAEVDDLRRAERRWRRRARGTGCHRRDQPQQTPDRVYPSLGFPPLAHGPSLLAATLVRMRSRATSKFRVDHHVALRPGAADEDISFRRWIERVGLVGDGPGDQSALAVVADAGAARPPHGHVARFRELEEALVLRGASERRSRCVRRTPAALCRGRPPADAARAPALATTPGVSEGPPEKTSEWIRSAGTPQAVRPVRQIAQEARWPAEIEVAISRDAELARAPHPRRPVAS